MRVSFRPADCSRRDFRHGRGADALAEAAGDLQWRGGGEGELADRLQHFHKDFHRAIEVARREFCAAMRRLLPLLAKGEGSLGLRSGCAGFSQCSQAEGQCGPGIRAPK